LCLAPEGFKKSKSGPWPKKVVHHCIKPCLCNRYPTVILYCIVLHLSISIAFLTAWAFQKCSRPQQLTLCLSLHPEALLSDGVTQSGPYHHTPVNATDWRQVCDTSCSNNANCNHNRNLSISSTSTKVKSRKPAYSMLNYIMAWLSISGVQRGVRGVRRCDGPGHPPWGASKGPFS